MNWWNVYLNGVLIDGASFAKNCDADYVKDSLVNHDGFDPGISVVLSPWFEP